MPIKEVLEMVSLLLLLFIADFIFTFRIAIMSIDRIEILHLKQQGDPRAKVLDELLQQPNRLITAILVCNSLVNTAAASLATVLAINIFGNRGIIIAILIVSSFLLVARRIRSKTITPEKTKKYFLQLPYLVKIIELLLFPIIIFLSVLSNVFQQESNEDKESDLLIGEESFKEALVIGEEEGVIKAVEKEMINSVFDFDNTIVQEIMTPKNNMVCVEFNESISKLKDIVVKSGLSRIPVYRDNLNNIVGIAYAKDLLPLLRQNEFDFSIKNTMRSPHYVKDTKELDKLLSELQKNRVHMSIVVDYYGKTVGLITIEDIIEEIVGDIQDEYDLDSKLAINNKLVIDI